MYLLDICHYYNYSIFRNYMVIPSAKIKASIGTEGSFADIFKLYTLLFIKGCY